MRLRKCHVTNTEIFKLTPVAEAPFDGEFVELVCCHAHVLAIEGPGMAAHIRAQSTT